MELAPDNLSVAPSGQRNGFLSPERIIESLGLHTRMVIADFGAGVGYFTIPMARTVGHDGKIYAIDIQKDALNLIKSKAKLQHLLNIEFVWADLELPNGSKLRGDSVDFVLIANILFQAGQKENVVNEAFRVLKPGGTLAFFEWDQSNFSAGPPLELRVSPTEARAIAKNAGLAFEREFNAGSHHYGFLFKK